MLDSNTMTSERSEGSGYIQGERDTIKVRSITDRSEIEAVLPACRKLAQESGAHHPFQYFTMPLLWWDCFNNLDSTDFFRKRGVNFLGQQCSLRDIRLLLAEDGMELIGAVPITTCLVKVPGEQKLLRVFTFSCDFQIMGRQDMTLSKTAGEKAVMGLVNAMAGLIQTEDDIVIIPYLTEGSPQTELVGEALGKISRRGFSCSSAITGRRGGIRAWTIESVISCLRQIMDRDVPSAVKESVGGLITDLAACPHMNLMFRKTRSAFEERVRAAVAQLEGNHAVSGMTATLKVLLDDVPVIYPFIRLPDDRETYMLTLGKSTRLSMQNYRNKFAKNGGLFEKIAPQDITGQDIDDYLMLHNRRWGSVSASLGSDATYRFHRDMCRMLASEGQLKLFFARYQDKRIAGCSCIDIQGRRELYITGRDPEYDRWRASRLLVLETILDAVDDGFSYYDMGLGWAAYKMDFMKDYATTRNFFISLRRDMIDLNNLYGGFEFMMHS